MKQHKLCRMREGWCRDCEVDSDSRYYKEDCRVPDIEAERDKARELREQLIKLQQENTAYENKIESLQLQNERLKFLANECVEDGIGDIPTWIKEIAKNALNSDHLII